MKVAANELFNVLREVVRDELKKALPGMVREVLAESYVRQIVSESVQPARKAAPISSAVQRMVPKQAVEGADAESVRAMIRSRVLEEDTKPTNPLLDDSNPMAFLYEDVKVPSDDTTPVGPPSISLDKFQFDAEKMRALVAPTAPRTEARGNEEFENRRLAKLRANLDVKVS